MEYCFRIDKESCQALTDLITASKTMRLARTIEARQQRIGAFQKKALSILLLFAPVLAAWFATHGSSATHGKPEDMIGGVIAFAMITLVYLWLWWRYRAAFIGFLFEHRRRWGLRWSRPLVAAAHRRIGRLIQKGVARQEGLHHWSLSPEALVLRGPSGKAVTLPWQGIAKVQDIGDFYQLATPTQKRLGRAYLLAKESTEMDAQAYREGIRQLLALIPAQAHMQPLSRSSAPGPELPDQA